MNIHVHCHRSCPDRYAHFSRTLHIHFVYMMLDQNTYFSSFSKFIFKSISLPKMIIYCNHYWDFLFNSLQLKWIILHASIFCGVSWTYDLLHVIHYLKKKSWVCTNIWIVYYFEMWRVCYFLQRSFNCN